MTYARKYLLQYVLNLAPDSRTDDDGNAAGARPTPDEIRRLVEAFEPLGIAKELGNRHAQFGGRDQFAERLPHDGARAIVIHADRGNSGSERFNQRESVAFVTRGENVEIRQSEESPLALTGNVTRKDDSGSSQARGQPVQTIEKAAALHECGIAA